MNLCSVRVSEMIVTGFEHMRALMEVLQRIFKYRFNFQW